MTSAARPARDRRVGSSLLPVREKAMAYVRRWRRAGPPDVPASDRRRPDVCVLRGDQGGVRGVRGTTTVVGLSIAEFSSRRSARVWARPPNPVVLRRAVLDGRACDPGRGGPTKSSQGPARRKPTECGGTHDASSVPHPLRWKRLWASRRHRAQAPRPRNHDRRRGRPPTRGRVGRDARAGVGPPHPRPLP